MWIAPTAFTAFCNDIRFITRNIGKDSSAVLLFTTVPTGTRITRSSAFLPRHLPPLPFSPFLRHIFFYNGNRQVLKGWNRQQKQCCRLCRRHRRRDRLPLHIFTVKRNGTVTAVSCFYFNFRCIYKHIFLRNSFAV